MSDEIDNMLAATPQAEQAEQTEQPQEAEQPEAQADGQQKPEQPDAGETQDAEADAKPEAEEAEPMVPASVIKAMRDDFREQMAEMRKQLSPEQPRQEPQPEPDVFEDPKAYSQHIQDTIRREVMATRLQISRFQAEREFGADAVKEVEEYFNQHPQLSWQFVNEPSPFHAAKAYVDAQKAASEIGSDPAAYREKLEAEIRAKVEAEMAAKQVSERAGKTAPSLAGVNGSGGQRDPGWQGPADLSAVIGR